MTSGVIFFFSIRQLRYPFPLMPAHFLDWSSRDQKDAPWWPRYCPDPKQPCPMQTMRWDAWQKNGSAVVVVVVGVGGFSHP